MSLSRSRFYVETPTTPSQRHSMFVSHSELDPHPDLSSASSSATLPSAAGSVDRLDKKPGRSPFSSLKSKAFSLRPFASLASLPLSKRKPRGASRRDSSSQTEPSRGEVGVQTQIASTVDVPVQTCSGEWEETSRRISSRRYSPWRPRVEQANGRTSSWHCESVPRNRDDSESVLTSKPLESIASVASSRNSECEVLSACLEKASCATEKGNASLKAVDNSSENLLRTTQHSKDPLASPKLLKYAAPSDSFASSLKSSLDSKGPSESSAFASSTVFSRNISASIPANGLLEKVSDTEITIENENVKAVTTSGSPEKHISVSACDDSKTVSSSFPVDGALKSNEGREKILDTTRHTILSSNSVDRGDPSKRFETTHIFSPDRTDSPSKSKQKSVHFDLPNAEISPKLTKSDLNKPRNVDDDFLALLRNLDILTEEPEESEVLLSPSSPVPKNSNKKLCVPDLKGAFDFLRQDFLAPILETAGETSEVEKTNEKSFSLDQNDSRKTSKVNEFSVNSSPDDAVRINVHKTSSPVTENENKQDPVKDASLKSTSLASFNPVKFKSVSEVQTSCNRENVYNLEREEKQNKPSKATPLPVPPNFFRSPPESSSLPISETADSTVESSPESPENYLAEMQLDSDFQRNRISRSSSRSSVRSESKPPLNIMHDTCDAFESRDNLTRVEEKLIDNLRCPNEGSLLSEKYIGCQSGSKSPDVSSISPTRMRRVILDRLLNGESIDDIVQNKDFNERRDNFVDSECSPHPDINCASKEQLCDEISVGRSSVLDTHQMDTGNPQGGTFVINYDYIHEMDTPKKTSVFLFPDVTFTSVCSPEKSSFEISTAHQSVKAPADLEVRRSSWSETPDIASNVSSAAAITPNTFSSKGKTQDSSGKCDFSSCLRPSQVQNSSFLSEVQPSAMPLFRPSAKEGVSHNGPNAKVELKSNSEMGECDYASCLKPSQVQNSVFTAELSEITASKSTNIYRDALLASTPLTSRTNSPCLSSSNTCVADKNSSASLDPDGEIQHKSEITINLCPCIPVTEAFPAMKTIEVIPAVDISELMFDPAINQQASFKSEVDRISSPHAIPYQDESSELRTDENLDTSTFFCSNGADSGVPSTSENTYKQTAVSDVYVNELQPTAVPPPPPPPPPTSQNNCPSNKKEVKGTESLQSLLADRHSNLAKRDSSGEDKAPRSKTPIMAELAQRFQDRIKKQTEEQIPTVSEKIEIDSQTTDNCSSGRQYENNISASQGFHSPNYSNGFQNGNDSVLLEHRFRSSSLPENQIGNDSPSGKKLTFSSNTVVTDAPPPSGAVLLEKKITVDGDQVHTDKFYAIPVKEVLKEKTSTTKFIPAPPKYEGIGPTEDGIPIGLRNSVKKENMHNWYKTMFKSLHKADSSNDTQEYLIGYSSEPETSTREKMMRKKSSTLDNRQKQDGLNMNHNKHQYPPSAKSSIEVYNVRPRLIEDYEPGYSSVTDDKPTIGLKRFLPAPNVPKPSYEFKNGYESDNTVLKKALQPPPLSPTQQKVWYREVQQGGEIPPLGLGKIVPEKPKEPVIGPIPPPPLNYRVQQTFPQATRPLTLPATYMNQNGNGLCHQTNGNYEVQMRSAIHSELQQRMSPISSQLSPTNRQVGKSPSRSPDLKLPARALFDFKAETNKEIPLKKGDVVLILKQLDKNWYEGEHLGVTGIFPISYVEIIPPEHVFSPAKSLVEGVGRALYDFSAHTSVELSVKKGDTLTLLRRVDTNWYEARFNNKKGIIPASYIQILQEPEKSFESSTLSSRSGLSSPIEKTYSPVRITTELERSSKYNSNSVSPHSASPVNRNERERLLNHNARSSNLIEPVMYRAMYSYNPQNSDELELQEGDMVCVVEICDDGWYVGTSARTGVFGIFPGNYVDKA